MQEMAADMKILVPYLYDKKAFQDPQNGPVISLKLKKMSERVHQITPEMGKTYFGQDPIENYSLQTMKADLGRAAEAFSQGRNEYARGVAKASTTHCFRCHSVVKDGGTSSWDLGQLDDLKLAPSERVDLIVATKKYDEAARYVESLVTDSDFVQKYPFELESVLRKYLSLMIRVENDPHRPLLGLQKVLRSDVLPLYIREVVTAWESSLKDWKKQTLKPSKKDLFSQGSEQIKAAGKRQEYSKDHSGDIEYLRATRLLHAFLRQDPPPQQRAQAYLLLGQAYEVLDDLGYWNLHEVYYESCVKTSPKSETAKKCFNRFEASVYLGYSGSSGVHIPAQEREKLKQLKEMTL